MSDRLTGIRAKTERANHHISDLKKQIEIFLDSNPYTVVGNNDPQTGHQVFTARISRSMDLHIPMTVGEVIHQLRSSLDHFAYQLVEANGSKPTKSTYFPITETLAKYQANLGRMVQGMSAGAVSVMDAIKPYQGGNSDLWKLHELNNFDKHRLLFIVGYSMNRLEINWRNLPFATIPGLAEFMRAPSTIAQNMPTMGILILKDDTEIMRLDQVPALDMNQNLKFTFDIAFGEPQIVKGKPVVPFLGELSRLVDGIVDQFVTFL